MFVSYIAFGAVIALYQGCGEGYDPSVNRSKRLIEAGFHSGDNVVKDHFHGPYVAPPVRDLPQ